MNETATIYYYDYWWPNLWPCHPLYLVIYTGASPCLNNTRFQELGFQGCFFHAISNLYQDTDTDKDVLTSTALPSVKSSKSIHNVWPTRITHRVQKVSKSKQQSIYMKSEWWKTGTVINSKQMCSYKMGGK